MARPLRTFNEFVGQPRVVGHTTRLIAGAKAMGKPCPSMLLTAPAGYGKSVFAEAVAREYGTTLHTLFAGHDTRAAAICEVLYALRYGDIFFIDEAHSLNQDAQQIIYMSLDQFKAPALREGRLDRSKFNSVAAHTLILATTEVGRIKKPLRSRLRPVEFDPYRVEELKAIAERVVRSEEVDITPQAARRLAEAAQWAPRSIYVRVESLRLMWPGVAKLTQEHVEALLASEGIDARGLRPNQRLYLFALAESPGGSCSLERLASRLGCDPAFIRQEVEPYLITERLVDLHSGRGRVITREGAAVAEELLAAERAAAPPEAVTTEEAQC
jgi:Holliday junction resolvasome RuvABC ATP-dependent DNA helicase subunit